MPVLLSASLEYGEYVSPIKLIVFVILFFAWMPLVKWFHADSQAVGTKERFWTAAITIAGGASLIITVDCGIASLDEADVTQHLAALARKDVVRQLVGGVYVDPIEWWDPSWVRNNIDARLAASSP